MPHLPACSPRCEIPLGTVLPVFTHKRRSSQSTLRMRTSPVPRRVHAGSSASDHDVESVELHDSASSPSPSPVPFSAPSSAAAIPRRRHGPRIKLPFDLPTRIAATCAGGGIRIYSTSLFLCACPMNGNCTLLRQLGAAATACRLGSEPPGPGSATSALPLPQHCMEPPTSAINVGFYINVAHLGHLTMPHPPHPPGAAQRCVQVHPAQA